MSDNIKIPMDPYKTIYVVKDKTGKKVGQIPATAKNESAYLNEMASFYGEISVDYEYNENVGLLGILHGGF